MPEPSPIRAVPGGSSRWRTATLALAVLAAATVPGVLTAPDAQAAVPTFPDNIVVFPDRDMVSLEGFAAASGQPVTIEVRRGGNVVGRAVGTGAGAAAIAAGSPTVEVNHPGGICWGATVPGSTLPSLAVTPDIRPGDVVTVGFGTVTADTTVQDAQVTDARVDGVDLTVTGHVGSGVDPAFLEQRIINPAMRDDPTITRRDVRAVTGPVAPAPKGQYTSGLAVNGTTFTAQYRFATAEAAQLAGEGSLRAMTWQDQDADGNRQGLTIAEAGETGGPGMGGCPPGATGQGPRSPQAVEATQGSGVVDVRWTPAAQAPGTSPVLGWTVRLVGLTSANGVLTETGVRLSDPGATAAQLPGTLTGRRVEVRAVSEVGESWPPAVPGLSPSPTSTDSTPPTVSASPAGGPVTGPVSVALAAESGAAVYYTLDGSSPLDGPDTVRPTSTPYGGPIAISPVAGTPVVLRYVAFDAAGNTSQVKNETYTLTSAAAPGAPTAVTATAGDGRLTVGWTAPASPGTSPVTGYTVTAAPTTGGSPVSATVGPNATQQALTGLVNGTPYAVSVTATNAVGTGPAGTTSAPVAPVRPAVDTVTVTRATWKAGDLRIEGTGSVPGATITVRSGGPTGPVLGTAVVGTPAAGAVSGTWTFRLRTAVVNTRPAGVAVTSSGGGVVSPVTLANA